MNGIMIKRPLQLILLSILVSCSMASFAEPAEHVVNPGTLINNMVTQLQNAIAANRDALESSPTKLHDLVERIIMPNVDVYEIAAFALRSKDKWNKATPKQKQDFICQFTLRLTQYYSNALLTFSDYNIKIKPLRINWQESDNVPVTGLVEPKKGGTPSTFTYHLKWINNAWKIVDLSIEGISIVQNYRAQFDDAPSMDAIIESLKKKNEDYESR